jgi:hypothetical protein
MKTPAGLIGIGETPLGEAQGGSPAARGKTSYELSRRERHFFIVMLI